MAASLLKQIAWPAKTDRSYLKIIYSNIQTSDDRPSRDTIIKLFLQCAQSVKVRILFDALDECNEDELGKIYQLIESFHKANIGVYITSRPHIVDHLQNRKSFADATYMEKITADRADISQFIKWRIGEHREQITANFTKKIIHKIGKAEGMYPLLDFQGLIT